MVFFEHDIEKVDPVLIKLSRIAANHTIPRSDLMRYERLLKPVFSKRKRDAMWEHQK